MRRCSFLRYWWLHGRKLYWQTRLVFISPCIDIYVMTYSILQCLRCCSLSCTSCVSFEWTEGRFLSSASCCMFNKHKYGWKLCSQSVPSLHAFRIIWNVLCRVWGYQLCDFPLHPCPSPPPLDCSQSCCFMMMLRWLLSSLSRSAGKCSAGSPLHICWPGLGSKKKKKITVGTRCTTHHLLHPIRPLTQNSWANISAIFHDWTSGKCHMGSSLYWSWQMYGRNKVYYFTFRLVLWNCVGSK